MKILVVFGTTEGQTAKIARDITAHLDRLDVNLLLLNAIDAGRGFPIGCFDAAIVAASLHKGRYQPAVVNFVREHREALDRTSTAFVSVSLAAAGNDPDDRAGLAQCVTEFEHATGWTPGQVEHVAGAFRFSRYGLLKRWLLKYVAYRKGQPTDTSQDYELTDWRALAKFVDAFAEKLRLDLDPVHGPPDQPKPRPSASADSSSMTAVGVASTVRSVLL